MGSNIIQTSGGGGGSVLLSSMTASASASIDFEDVFSSEYTSYNIVLENVVPVVANTHFRAQLGSSGSTYLTGNINAQTSKNGAGGNFSGDVLYGVDYFPIAQKNGVDDEPGYGLSGLLTITTPSNASTSTALNGMTGSPVASSLIPVHHWVTGFSDVASTNTIKFYMSSGNISTGTIKIYGLL